MIRTILLGALDAVRSRHGDRIKRLCRKAGLLGILLAITERTEVALSDTHLVSVGEANAEFQLNSHTELKRLTAVDREQAVIKCMLKIIEQGDVFFDIGSNVATHSCLICNTVSKTEAVAIEAHPGNARRARENLSLNDIPARIINVALSEESGQLDLGLGPGGIGEGKHQLLRSDDTYSGEAIRVPTISGDALVAEKELPSPNVVKIDVEGAELEVIRGFSSHLREPTCRSVFCEVHPHLLSERGEDADAVEKHLGQLGFKTERIEERGTEYFIHASKPSE